MGREALVSIVVPFFNAAKFFEEAIQSVLDQSHRSWELFLVDDGSNDESLQIARRYVERYPKKVHYLEHAGHINRGMSATRNLGIHHSRGEYIALLDADDVWLRDKLKDQVAILDAHPEVGMVYGATRYWHSWTGEPEDQQSDYTPELGVPTDVVINPPRLLTLFLQSKAPTPCPSDILLRRDLISKIGGFEEAFRGVYQLFEDQVFLAKVCLKIPVFVANRCWDNYRLHPDSCVAVVNRSGHKYRVGLVYLKWLSRYLAKHDVINTELWQALKKKRSRYRRELLLQWQRRARQAIGSPRDMLQLCLGRRSLN